MDDLHAFRDGELVVELQARGYSVSKFKFSGIMTEAVAKRIRKNRTPLNEPLTDKHALKLWTAASEGTKT